MVRQAGVEPTTHGLEGRCSILLSYWRTGLPRENLQEIDEGLGDPIYKQLYMPDAADCVQLENPGGAVATDHGISQDNTNWIWFFVLVDFTGRQ